MIFLDKNDILSGTPQNGLYPLEVILKQAYKARTQSDLAQCVVDGRKIISYSPSCPTLIDSH